MNTKNVFVSSVASCCGGSFVYGMLFAVWLASAMEVRAVAQAYPADAGLVNVKTWSANPALNAKGDGVTDDTAAIQACISANVGQNPCRIIYFPSGTYLVSDTLNCVNAAGQAVHRNAFLGEDMATTTLRLKNNATGFGTKGQTTSKPILKLRNNNNKGNDGYLNYVWNLTFDVGVGNLGANGVEWAVCNVGSLRNIRVRSSDPNKEGYTGIITAGWPGPGYMKDIEVDGFDNGILLVSDKHSITMENLTLSNQKVYGIWNIANMPIVRNATITNCPQPYYQSQRGTFVFVDCNFTTSTPSPSVGAMLFLGGDGFVRNVTTAGYSSVVTQKLGSRVNVMAAGPNVTEWSGISGKENALFPVTSGSLNLPVENAPEFQDNNFANWARVDGSATDDTDAIQSAMNSGKPIVYLPSGTYQISNTVTIPSTVKKVIGMNSNISGVGGNFGSGVGSPRPLFRISGGTSSDFTIIEKIVFTVPVVLETIRNTVDIEHGSPRTLALADGTISAYVGNVGAGKLFVENINGVRFDINGGNAWFRQLNVESLEGTKVFNKGGTVWMLGYKTEMNATNLVTTGSGKSEILGAFIFCNSGSHDTPSFVNNNSDSYIVFAQYFYAAGHDFLYYLQDIRNGETRMLPRYESSGPILNARRSSASSPSITLATPANGSSIAEGQSFSFSANATGNGTITVKAMKPFAAHSIVSGSTPDPGPITLGSGSGGSFSGTWTPPSAGTWVVYAVLDSGTRSVSGASKVEVEPAAGVGRLTRQYWENVLEFQSTLLFGLEDDERFPNNESLNDYVTEFSSPRIVANRYYGIRLAGYITPPTTGNYTFYISSGNQASLRLSTDANPLNKRLICRVADGTATGQTEFGKWDATPERKSTAIPLVAGQKYYVEALNKQDHSRVSHVEVAWDGPGIARQLIPGSVLSPWNPATPDPVINPGAGIVELSPLDNTWIRAGGTQNANYGTTRTFVVGDNLSEGYLGFDLSSEAGTLISATLEFVPLGVVGSPACQLQDFPNDAWNERTMTWNTRPSGSGTVITSWVPQTNQPVSLDVTPQVARELAGDKQISFRVISPTNLTTANAPVYGSSREIPEFRPILTLEFEPPANVDPPIRINFQPVAAAIPPDYLVDSGLAYGARGNGKTYGWFNGANPASPNGVWDRNSVLSPDQRYDTLISISPSFTGFRWEIEVPNGAYQVRVVAGDPRTASAIYKYALEGVAVVDGAATAAMPWVEGIQNVSVTDGKLSLTRVAGSNDNRLCFIEIFPQ